jgi:hypothetical protein
MPHLGVRLIPGKARIIYLDILKIKLNFYLNQGLKESLCFRREI